MSAAAIPESCRWLTAANPERASLAVRLAHADLNLCESGVKNRNPTIDRYHRLACAPVPDDPDAPGLPYCGSAVTAWWRGATLETPPLDPRWWRAHGLVPSGPAATDAWDRWARITRRFVPLDAAGVWRRVVYPGCAVLYGTGREPDPAHHIGLLARLGPGPLERADLCTYEGNTSRDGAFSREGDAFVAKWMSDPRARGAYGFVLCFPRP